MKKVLRSHPLEAKYLYEISKKNTYTTAQQQQTAATQQYAVAITTAHVKATIALNIKDMYMTPTPAIEPNIITKVQPKSA